MSDEATFNFVLYLGTTTPLTVTGATAATVGDLTERLRSDRSFVQTVRFPDMSIMDHHHFTPNGSRPSTRSVETSKKSAMRDTSRNVKFERPWNLSLMVCSETPSSCARSRCVT